MRIILFILYAILITSCNQKNAGNRAADSHHIERLEIRIDSLVTALNELKTQKGNQLGKPKTANNKVGIITTNPVTTYVQPVKQRRTKAAAVSYNGQCRATTKKGYQCSRKAGSDGYCWQHGG